MENCLLVKPRVFRVSNLAISDYGVIQLQPLEMISIQKIQGGMCDITATPWGFYLGGSTNVRMKEQGFCVAVVRNSQGKTFVNAVEIDKLDVFEEYLTSQGSQITMWL